MKTIDVKLSNELVGWLRDFVAKSNDPNFKILDEKSMGLRIVEVTLMNLIEKTQKEGYSRLSKGLALAYTKSLFREEYKALKKGVLKSNNELVDEAITSISKLGLKASLIVSKSM